MSLSRVDGFYYPANSSNRSSAVITVVDGYFTVLAENSEVASGEFSGVSVSPRIGQVPRRLEFADGSLFESADNDSIDSILSLQSNTAAVSIIDKLEKSWPLVVASVILLVGLGYSAFRWGIPAAATHVAMRLPVSVNEAVSSGAVQTLDRIIFKPTQLDISKQAQVREQFNRLTAALENTEFNYRIYFRQMGYGDFKIPNAMALPSGEIIVTDSFINMIEHPDELNSVLLHEIGHVEERHGMQQMLQASAVSVIATTAIGDVGGVNELVAGLPIFLLQSQYPRESETAADNFSFDKMIEMGMDPKHFAAIIRRLGQLDESAGADEQAANNYFSSHPGIRERAQRAMERSRALPANLPVDPKR